jgi:hypothetical protein
VGIISRIHFGFCDSGIGKKGHELMAKRLHCIYRGASAPRSASGHCRDLPAIEVRQTRANKDESPGGNNLANRACMGLAWFTIRPAAIGAYIDCVRASQNHDAGGKDRVANQRQSQHCERPATAPIQTQLLSRALHPFRAGFHRPLEKRQPSVESQAAGAGRRWHGECLAPTDRQRCRPELQS